MKYVTILSLQNVLKNEKKIFKPVKKPQF